MKEREAPGGTEGGREGRREKVSITGRSGYYIYNHQNDKNCVSLIYSPFQVSTNLPIRPQGSFERAFYSGKVLFLYIICKSQNGHLPRQTNQSMLLTANARKIIKHYVNAHKQKSSFIVHFKFNLPLTCKPCHRNCQTD
jgi:hypothetical protein